MNKKKSKQTKKYRNIGKIQQITWLDHHSRNGWHDHNEAPNDVTAVTVGKLIYEDNNYARLASNWSEDVKNIDMEMNILKACIVERRTLR